MKQVNICFGKTVVQACLVAAVLAQVIGRNAWGQNQYTVTGLGFLRVGIVSEAYGINNLGQVVGVSATIGNSYGHAFVYSGGVMGYVGSSDPDTISFAYAVNNSGQVVGVTDASGNGNIGQAFLNSGGSTQTLGFLSGGASSKAYGINDAGQVVGGAWTGQDSGSTHAFVFSGGSMQDLGAFPGNSLDGTTAFGINNSGQVVGCYFTNVTNTSIHAFSYSGGVISDLGTLGGLRSFAGAINDSGQIVGFADTASGIQDAMMYSGNGPMADLGTLAAPYHAYSEALGINNNGQVVGFAGANSINGNGNHAFLYSGGSMSDLNNLIDSGSGWTLEEATGINDSGQICGFGIDPNGLTDAFLLTPITVPEPSSLVLGLLVLAALSVMSTAGGRPRKWSVSRVPRFTAPL